MKVQTSSGYLAISILALSLCTYAAAQSGVTAPQAAAEQTAAAPQLAAEGKRITREKPKTVYESSTVLKAVTRFVVVDVVATNKSDQPVTDLQAQDFILQEDGQPQQIRSFGFQRGVAADAKQSPRRPLPLPPGVVTNFPQYKSDGSLNVILLDSLNTFTLDQIGARDQALKVLEQLPPGRAIAVYALSTKLHLIHDFATDPAELKNAVASFKAENSILIDNPTDGPKYQYVHPALEQIANASSNDWTEVRLRSTLEAMSSLARGLAGYPGRKNLIWISSAFPQMVNPLNKNYTELVTRTGDLLSNSQIAVYPVDARGEGTTAALRAENGYGAATGPGLMAALSKDGAALLDAHNTMNELADLTGGKAFYNRNDLSAAISRSMDDGSTYYTLGYYPSNKNWNGKFRKITLALARPDIQLRYRVGYLAADATTYQKQAAAQRAEDFGLALNLDYPVSTALLFQAGILPPSAGKRRKVAVNYLLDAHQIGFEKDADGLQHADLDYAIMVYSEKGKPVKTDVTSIALGLPPEPFKQVMRSGFPYQKTLDLAPGNYILRLGIRDNRTGLIGTGTGRITVSPQDTAQSPNR